MNSYIPGLNDLDYYGDWQNVNGYGYAWSPRVDAAGSPYQQGYWYTDYPYGPTWVSSEPWGMRRITTAAGRSSAIAGTGS